MFGHGMHRIVANIGHRHTALSASIHVNHVIAGGGHGNQFQVGQLGQSLATNWHFVGDDYACALQTLDHVFGSGLHMLGPLMRKRRLAKISP